MRDTSNGTAVTSFWTDPANARAWVTTDGQAEVLALPRRIAAELVAHDRPGTRHVLDVGSGTGPFLATFLDRFPDAHGLWTDVSPTMETEARAALAGYGDRVTYRITTMQDLSALPHDLDVVMTSRCAHHLDPLELGRFYTAAAEHLAPGGWLVNLDHTRAEPTWDARLRAVRTDLLPPRPGPSTHHHDKPLPTVSEHLAAFAAAGLDDVEIAWRAFVTCLFVARRPD